MAVFDVCFCFVPLLLLTIISIFPVLIFSTLFTIPICQPSQLLYISSVSVTTARLSANSSSFGRPHVNSSLMTSSTTINRNGLSPDPWCSPTLMRNSSVLPCVVLTSVLLMLHCMLVLLTSLASLGSLSYSDTNTPDP